MSSSLLKDENEIMLVEVLDRVLNKGVVITGDLTLGVADIDLLYCGIRILLTSVENIEQINQFSNKISHDSSTSISG